MKSTALDATEVKAGRKDRADLELKKPYAVFRCIKFMKVVDRENKYFNYYSEPRKTVQWPNVCAKPCALQ
jgi:hypothetical protein